MRIKAFLLFSLLLAATLPYPALSEPGTKWEQIDAMAAGWQAQDLKSIASRVSDLNTTGFVVIQHGKQVAAWGNVSRGVNVASVRKSLLSALYGNAVAAGQIKLDSTLTELGIDDKPPTLTATEKQATVRDLISARSGIYHPAAYETADIKRKRPKRGSHVPGTFWFYNNWDFNAAGTIYRQQTGEDIFQSFDKRIAKPIGMEDFTANDGVYKLEDLSVHPAYPMKLSARDLARFGLLYLNGSQWNGKQIVPSAWVAESTTAYSRTERGTLGYGYMWWTLRPAAFGSGAFMAAGYGGQFLAVVPSKNLVVVETVHRNDNAKGVRMRDFVNLLRDIVAAAP